MSGRDDSDAPSRRGVGRYTTRQEEAYRDDHSALPDDMDPDGTGIAPEYADSEGFQQPTAMFDRGEFLGELGRELNDYPETRARVAAEDTPKGCRLIIVSGPDLGLEWAFKQSEITFGRSSENDIDFSDIAMSRNHAKIVLEGDHFFLMDLESNNGTILNGAAIRKEQLVTGDEIILGARTLRFVELNEAPPTAAAHPVLPDMPDDADDEPVEGGDSDLVSVENDPFSDDSGSEINVAALPAAAPSQNTRRHGLRGIVVAAGVLGVIATLGWMGYTRFVDPPEARMKEARRVFLQGVELVKSLRCADALVLFDRVLELRPEYVRAKEYKAYCSSELQQFEAITAAIKLAEGKRYQDALEKFKSVEKTSQYHKEAERWIRRMDTSLAKAKLLEARRLLGQGEANAARVLALDVAREFPSDREANALIEAVDEHNAIVPPVVKKKKRTPKIPLLMVSAIDLYLDGRIAEALDAAEAAGGKDAPSYLQRMRKVKSLLGDAKRAHRNKDAPALLRLAPKALETDKTLAHGKGTVRSELNRYYADGLYLSALESQQAGELEKAYRLLKKAVRVQPGHGLSTNRLRELSRRALELFSEAEAIKIADPEQARALYSRVRGMTPTDDEYHRLADKRLRDLGETP